MNTTTEDTATAALNTFGITPVLLEAAKRGGSSGGFKQQHRQTHIDDVRKHASSLIEAAGGVQMQCALTVLRALVERGCARTAGGAVIRGANALGDTLGRHGLCLPCINKGGKMRYALHFANASTEEKEAAQVILNELSAIELRALPVA